MLSCRVIPYGISILRLTGSVVFVRCIPVTQHQFLSADVLLVTVFVLLRLLAAVLA